MLGNGSDSEHCRAGCTDGARGTRGEVPRDLAAAGKYPWNGGEVQCPACRAALGPSGTEIMESQAGIKHLCCVLLMGKVGKEEGGKRERWGRCQQLEMQAGETKVHAENMDGHRNRIVPSKGN